MTDGHDRGNGGDALVCKNAQGQITSAHFFDLYEAKEKFGMNLVAPQGSTISEKVLNLIDRVSGIDPIRAKTMKLWYSSFMQEASFKSGITLVDVPDTGDAFWPKECELAQLVVQTDLNPPLNPYRYIFSKDIWQLLDDNNKAATIVHELLWREARFADHKTSAAIRYFNGLFQADSFKNLNFSDYSSLIEKLQLLIHSTLDGYPVGPLPLFESLQFETNLGKFKFPQDTGSLYNYNSFNSSNGYANIRGLNYILDGQPNLPSLINLEHISRIDLEDGNVYIAGKFNIQQLKARVSYLQRLQTYGDLWFAGANMGLLVSLNNAGIQSVKVGVRGAVGDLADIQNMAMNPDQERVDWVVLKTDHSFQNQKVITCRAMNRIDLDTTADGVVSLASCVLSRDVRLNDYKWNEVLVRAGKRVYVDSAFRLKKVE
jgi:hypothetical protein